VVGALIAFTITSFKAPVEVSAGDVTVKIGERETSIPMGEAMGDIYNMTKDNTAQLSVVRADISSLTNRMNVVEDAALRSEEYTNKSIVRQVEKQYDKIHKDPEDVKFGDITAVMEDWELLPVEMRTPTLAMKMDSLKKWARERI